MIDISSEQGLTGPGATLRPGDPADARHRNVLGHRARALISRRVRGRSCGTDKDGDGGSGKEPAHAMLRSVFRGCAAFAVVLGWE